MVRSMEEFSHETKMHRSVACTHDRYSIVSLEDELSVHGVPMCVELTAPRMSSIFAFCDSSSRTSSTGTDIREQRRQTL